MGTFEIVVCDLLWKLISTGKAGTIMALFRRAAFYASSKANNDTVFLCGTLASQKNS